MIGREAESGKIAKGYGLKLALVAHNKLARPRSTSSHSSTRVGNGDNRRVSERRRRPGVARSRVEGSIGRGSAPAHPGKMPHGRAKCENLSLPLTSAPPSHLTLTTPDPLNPIRDAYSGGGREEERRNDDTKGGAEAHARYRQYQYKEVRARPLAKRPPPRSIRFPDDPSLTPVSPHRAEREPRSHLRQE